MPLDLQARRDLARILDDAFALYRAHWRTLLAVSAAIVIPVQVGVLGLGLGWLFSDYDSTRPQGEVIAGVASQLFVVTPARDRDGHPCRRRGRRPASGVDQRA